MAKNVFVSYDLDAAPPERYAAVRKMIEDCSSKYSWIQFSLAYIKTDLRIEFIAQRVRSVMHATDKLAVIESVDANVSPLSSQTLTVFQREFTTA